MAGDIASQMIDGIDKFLLRETAESIGQREAQWDTPRDFSSHEAYEKSLARRRERLAKMLGLRDSRVKPINFHVVHSKLIEAEPLATGSGYEIYRVRWRVLEGFDGAGLLAVPKVKLPRGFVICVPDASQTPEAMFGLAPGISVESQFARRLAENGCWVIVPTLINRQRDLSATMNGTRMVDITHREFLYRPSFELGRHVIGYELQSILALVSHFESTALAVVGHGDGGMLALYAGALDPRIKIVGVSGYFRSRQNLWQEPIDRNVFGMLKYFGDAELASMIAPRKLLIEACAAPEMTVAPGGKGGPGRIVTPAIESVQAEFARAKELTAKLDPQTELELSISGEGRGPAGSDAWLTALLATIPSLSPETRLVADSRAQAKWKDPFQSDEKTLAESKLRHERLFNQIHRHTQALLVESPYVRAEFMKNADRTSRDPQKFVASMKPYRDYFRTEVIGAFDLEKLPLDPRSRQVQETDKYTMYEVVLDVFPDVFAYGLYIVPKGIAPGERRPVVVCQHGLEGRPQDVIGEQRSEYYSAFATKLAEEGFITFAPQNIYIFKDRFRTLQRKANPLGKTLFSIMVPQHEQIVKWLGQQPEVDPARIGFYGLSYGGKSAMRIPALVEGYALSICSADFNEWIWKNASTRSQYTYVGTGEYEIYEFDLGSTFNYSEMAALICPRPFMVERGHRDGVAPDDMVAAEFARVKLLYVDLQIPDRTEIEFFDGPHSIHGVGTFAFLRKHLKWEKSEVPNDE
jgi:dienelactone hydrolase